MNLIDTVKLKSYHVHRYSNYLINHFIVDICGCFPEFKTPNFCSCATTYFASFTKRERWECKAVEKLTESFDLQGFRTEPYTK